MLSEDISRVGDKLHSRNHPGRKIRVKVGVFWELAATLDAIAILYFGVRWQSGWLVGVGAFLICYTMQVLVKMTTGTLFGVRYSYFYRDFGVEARVKMRYGTYLAVPRFARFLLHLAGTVGSPVAVFVVAAVVRPSMPNAAHVCSVVARGLLVVQCVLFIMPLVGIRKVRGIGVDRSSGGAAARELCDLLRAPKLRSN
jgi:hypothetical protein